MTLADLMDAHREYTETEDARRIEGWRQTRMMVHTMARLWGDPKTVPKTAEAFFPLPGDPKGQGSVDIETMTPEEQKQIFQDLRAEGWQV